jgi:mono/diheme cytochrome c family protein/cbb3-type cytochrome oxidase subunit 3
MKLRILPLLLVLSLSLTACISLAEDVTPPPDYVPPATVAPLSETFPAAAPDVANGAVIYAEKCAPCHGPTGQADGPQASMLPVEVPALGQPEVARLASPSRWYTIVTEGNLNNFMPGFASLTDQERWDVVAYAHSLSVTPAEIQAGQAVYDANCALCHGPQGKSVPDADLTNLQWLASRSLDEWAASVSKGMAPGMPAFEGQLADADIYASLAYARTFAYTAPQAPARAEQATPAPEPVSGEESASEADTPAEGESAPDAPVETDETAEATGGQVSGLITSGAGGVLPSGLTVVLHGFDHDVPSGSFSEVVTLEAAVGADGRYLFENVEMPEGRAFYVSLDYAGVEYASDAAFVQDGLETFDLPIQIYETSADPSVLEISQAHILLDFSNPDVVSVIHYLVINNPTERTIVSPGEGQPVVSFSLPEGFSNLQFENGVMGGRFMPTADGFGDQVSILPGADQYQLVFAYDLPHTAPTGLAVLFGGGSTDLSIPLTLSARSVTVLVPEGVTADGTNFVDAGLQSMGSGINFQMYRAGELPAGENLDFKISGAPRIEAAGGPADNNQNLIIGIGALGLALILVGGYLFWRDRRKETEAASDAGMEESDDEEEDDDPGLDEDEILDAIVALDDQFKDGNISEAAYRERRAELKTQLKKLQ